MLQYSLANILAIAGISLQILGFILMIKYHGKKPKYDEVSKWLKKEETKHPDGLKWEINTELEYGIDEPRIISMKTPKAFGRYWSLRTKSGLTLNIMGLILLIMQIILQ